MPPGICRRGTDLNAIVIAFQVPQESSLQNWIEDLYWKQLDISYPGMEGAMVYHGFYSAYHNNGHCVRVQSALERAKKLYEDIQIIVTGHSMGGAMAASVA
ncbi:hypothetical protein HAX54_033929 [Datura stramonium]|uniref:Fungal lipase-type domain-containing protein n=1 Tax=Datura stramonium TaxID=4076 RepID=A0ABS8VD48_DATST|nr:hypothetical protein [Datura stramonium]